MGVLVLEAGVGALARLYEEQVGPELRMNLNRTFLETYSLRSRETAAIDQMQKEVSKSNSSCTRVAPGARTIPGASAGPLLCMGARSTGVKTSIAPREFRIHCCRSRDYEPS